MEEKQKNKKDEEFVSGSETEVFPIAGA